MEIRALAKSVEEAAALGVIPAKFLINRFWFNENHYTNALVLLVVS